jgi:hypothetical protein
VEMLQVSNYFCAHSLHGKDTERTKESRLSKSVALYRKGLETLQLRFRPGITLPGRFRRMIASTIERAQRRLGKEHQDHDK